MEGITELNEIQGKIVGEICEACASERGCRGLETILGSWGDTLPDADILRTLQQWNSGEWDEVGGIYGKQVVK